MSEWISVNDYLPPEGKDVLVLRKSGGMDICHYVYDKNDGYAYGWYPGGCPVENTSHWMELPEPPK